MSEKDPSKKQEKSKFWKYLALGFLALIGADILLD